MSKDDKTEIVDFTAKFQSQKDLREYARAQFLTLLQTKKRVDHLEQENRQLRSQIAELQSKQNTSIEIIPRSDEQVLCEIEIRRLKELSMERALSLEETKRLDLLVKNLNIAKGKNNAIPASAKKAENISEAELVQVASLPKTED